MRITDSKAIAVQIIQTNKCGGISCSECPFYLNMDDYLSYGVIHRCQALNIVSDDNYVGELISFLLSRGIFESKDELFLDLL